MCLKSFVEFVQIKFICLSFCLSFLRRAVVGIIIIIIAASPHSYLTLPLIVFVCTSFYWF